MPRPPPEAPRPPSEPATEAGQPDVSRRLHWASHFVLLALGLLLVVPPLVAVRASRIRAEISGVAGPAHELTSDVLTQLAIQVSAVRGYLLTGNAALLELADSAGRENERVYAQLEMLAHRLGPRLAARVADLRAGEARWSAAAELLARGELSPDEYDRQLPLQQLRFQEAILAASRLDAGISDAAAERRDALRRITWLSAAVTVVLALLALGAAMVVQRLTRRIEAREHAARIRAREEERLRDVARTLTTTFELPVLLQRIAEGARIAGRSEGAFVERVDDARTNVEVVAVSGASTPPIGARVPYPGSLAEDVLERREPECVANLGAEPRPISGHLNETCPECSALVVPLVSEDEAVGALILLRLPGDPPFSDDEVRRAALLGDLAAVAVRRALLYAESEAKAIQLEEAEQAVRAGEAAHRMLVEAAPVIMWLNDPDGTMRFANRRLTELVGVSSEHLAGSAWLERVVHRADRDEVRSRRDAALAAGEPYEVECRFLRHDGTARWHQVRVVPTRSPRGEITAWIGAATDVDELRRTERAQRFLVEAGEVLATSLEFEETLGRVARLAVPAIADFCALDILDEQGALRRAATAHVSPAGEAVLRQQRPYSAPRQVENPLHTVIATGQPLLVRDLTDEWLRSVRLSAEQLHGVRALRPTSIIVVPLRARETVVGILSLGQAQSGRHYDHTDLRAAEELGRLVALAIENARLFREARAATAEAQRASRAKSEFLAVMSHELRTPINAVVGYADLLEAGIAGGLAPAQAQYVDRIKVSSRHLTTLISDVLDLSRIEAGELRVRDEAVPARRTAADALALALPLATAKRLTLVEDLDGCPPELRYRGDEDRVRQILLNLLSNAVKFTGEGGRVRVGCRVEQHRPAGVRGGDDGPWIGIEVEDTGVGIAPEHLSRIFEPFVQVEMGYTRQQGGTGLGLTISRTLARLMGGDVTVRSEPGRGSCFALWLRAASPASPAFPEAPA